MPVSNQSPINVEAKRKELEELALFLMKTEKEIASIRAEMRRLQAEDLALSDKEALHQVLQKIAQYK